MPDLKPQAKAPKPEKTEKQPSRFFTEYYGAAFLLLIAVFVVLALVFIRPMIDQIKETNAQTQAELATADSETGYLNSLDASIVAAQTISPDVLDRVNQALPNDANIPALLVQFGSAAYTNGIKIDSLAFAVNKAAPTPASGNAAPTVLPVDITIGIHAHSYFDVKRFLTALETSLRIMDVQGMTAGGTTGDVFYTMQLRTYTFNDTSATTTKP